MITEKEKAKYKNLSKRKLNDNFIRASEKWKFRYC